MPRSRRSCRRAPGLITLTGVGGVGKTRLATHTAAQVQVNYANGARLVTLAEVPEGAEIASTILAGLGLRERPHTMSAETLTNALRDARLLLVLDNCEHVVQSSAELVDRLLRSCPGVQILATSRESLSVPGERVYPVQPLVSPAEDEPFATVLRSDAVELFADRAAERRPGFQLTPASGAAVASHLSPAGWHSAGDRACRCAYEDHEPGGDIRPSGRSVGIVDACAAHGARTPADAARDH